MTYLSKLKKTLNIQERFIFIKVTLLLLVTLSIMPNSAFADPIVWTNYGGDWSTTGSVYSVSYAAKEQRLIALDSHFSDFSLEADIHFADNRNGGNAGFNIRMNNPTMDNGYDSENAYYIGINSAGTAVYLGNQHYGFDMLADNSIVNNLNNTYHLKVVAVGNSLKVYVDDILKIDFIDTNNTYTTGMIGLRAFVTDASYSNLNINNSIVPTTTDTETIDDTTKFVTVNLQVNYSGSAFVTTYYRVDNGAPIAGNSLEINTDGIHLLTYWSEVQGENIEDKKFKVIKVNLNSLDNRDNVNIDDIVILLNQEGKNGIGTFNTDEISLMLGALGPISN